MELPAAERFPPPDEHIAEPETDREMLDGRVIRVSPAAPPHADRQVAIGYVLNATAAPGYVASSELLTRVSEDSDFATDVCIRKAGKDADGHRFLEELSFEIKHTQSEGDLEKRARYLARRGVRRVFAVYVRVSKHGNQERVIAGPIKEWSGDNNGRDGWRELADNAVIDDRCLHRPVKVRALLDAFEADNAVAHALLDKNNPVLVKRENELLHRERRQAIRDLCQALAIELTSARHARIDSLSADQLHALRDSLLEHRRWDESL